MDEEIIAAIEELFNRITEPAFLFKTGAAWPEVAQQLLAGHNEEYQKQFWLALEAILIDMERSLGHIHKGGIYWRLSIIFLGQGQLTQAIHYLELSSTEDQKNGENFSAAIGLSSIINPLIHRFKNIEWKFDGEIMKFYESLTPDERREFATRLATTHNQVALKQIPIIKDEYFHFIIDEEIRRIVHDSYIEIRDIILNVRLTTYFSCIFSTGSILEGMLDDLITRNNQEIWHLFRENKQINQELNKGSKLRKTTYDAGCTLGEKIMVLRMLAKNGVTSIPKVPILQMLIIAEYRDLIHPRRRRGFAFKANDYVAAFIFIFINQIASHWWQNSDHMNKLPTKKTHS